MDREPEKIIFGIKKNESKLVVGYFAFKLDKNLNSSHACFIAEIKLNVPFLRGTVAITSQESSSYSYLYTMHIKFIIMSVTQFFSLSSINDANFLEKKVSVVNYNLRQILNHHEHSGFAVDFDLQNSDILSHFTYSFITFIISQFKVV